MKLKSPSFKPNEKIPAEFTCDGGQETPPLEILDAPEGTVSFALIMEDPDAPQGTFTHWLLCNLPASERKLPQNFLEDAKIKGLVQGENSLKKSCYTGPCPPIGKHRYFFKVFALDSLLNLSEGFRGGDLKKKMQGHILAEAELMGTYEKTPESEKAKKERLAQQASEQSFPASDPPASW